jgi:hypothetical protein
VLIRIQSKNILSLEKALKRIKNLRVVLKKSGGMHFPGKEVPADELSAFSRPGATIPAGEQRLRKLNEIHCPGHEFRSRAGGWIGKNV